MLLLDTHAWIWSVEGDVSRIGRRARRLIAAAETRARILVSVVTLFELAALHTAAATGRVRVAEAGKSFGRRSPCGSRDARSIMAVRSIGGPRVSPAWRGSSVGRAYD